MNSLKTAFALFGLLCLLALQPASAQGPQRIGYTNAELVLSLMPEAQSIEQQLRTYQQNLMQVLGVKQSYMETKLREYQELKAANRLTADEEQRRRTELEQLNQEVEQSMEDAQQKLLAKRDELLQPLLEKLQRAIEDVARAEGYTYILNANVEGSSVILYGAESENVTRKILTKLGIQIPANLDATPGVRGSSTPSGGGSGTPSGGTTAPSGGGTTAPSGGGGNTRPAPGGSVPR